MSESKQEYVVALQVDKVQTFLTEVINSHSQDKQTEAATLKNIMKASQNVSNNFYKTIKRKFPEIANGENENENVLLKCSGVYIFKSSLSENEIKEILKEMFLEFYTESQGQKMLLCTYFSADNMATIDLLKKAKLELKKAKCMNKIIEETKDSLFEFCLVKKAPEKVVNDVEQKSYEKFATDLDALFTEKEDTENVVRKNQDSKHFRMAVIKADLDGMGNMFKEINEYDEYKIVSGILNEQVSLNGLHEAAKKYNNSGEGWIFPFYVAGDDIFFAVSVENLIYGIEVCHNMLCSINEKLQEKENLPKLTMSIGVEITFNNLPVRYYMDMVEAQLKNAKVAEICSELNVFLEMKISICTVTYFYIDYNKVKEVKEVKKAEKDKENIKKLNRALNTEPIWCFLVSDIKLINEVKADAKYKDILATSGFFYTLLQNLTALGQGGNQNIKYINTVLYHLLPKYSESSDENLVNYELRINVSIIKRLFKHDKKGKRIDLSGGRKHNLETYLRLMILFADPRFSIKTEVKSQENVGNKCSKKKDEKDKKDERKNDLSDLLSKPVMYLYDEVLVDKNKLRNVFVVKTNYKKNGKENFECYRMLNIKKSMFFKLRKLAKLPKISIKKNTRRDAKKPEKFTSEMAAEMAAEMIKLKNSMTIDDVNKVNEQREIDSKAPSRLYFDDAQFKENFANFTPDFVDSIMLLYEYKQMSMTFNKTKVAPKNSKGGNAK